MVPPQELAEELGASVPAAVVDHDDLDVAGRVVRLPEGARDRCLEVRLLVVGRQDDRESGLALVRT
jgi:hypothetical protein